MLLDAARCDGQTEKLCDVIMYHSHEDVMAARNSIANFFCEHLFNDVSQKNLRLLLDVLTLYHRVVGSKLEFKFEVHSYKTVPPLFLEMTIPLVNNFVEAKQISRVVSKIIDSKF